MKERVVLAVLALALAMSGVFAARLDAAGGPIVYRDDIDDTFTTGFCGFPLEVHQTGTGVFHVFLDENGDFERVIIASADIKISFTNLNTGESVWTPSVNMTYVAITDDGTGTQSYRGLLWRLVLPHEGLVTADVGKIDFLYTFDENGNVISEDVVFLAGQQDNQFISTICAVLGS